MTSAQAAAAGIGPRVLERMVADGSLTHLAYGLYLVPEVIQRLEQTDPDVSQGWQRTPSPGAWHGTYRRGKRGRGRMRRGPAHPPLAMAWAGVLHAGTPCGVGGWHCLMFEGVRVLPARLAEPVQVWVTDQRSLLRTSRWRFRRDGAGRLARVLIPDPRDSGLPGLALLTPMIPLGDAVIDVAGELPESEAVGVVLDALSTQRLPPERLAERLEHRRMVRHRRLLADVVGDFCGGVHSMLEHRYATDVERAHGLPVPSRQRVVPGGRVDVLYDAFDAVIELDGRAFHTDRFRDAARDNANAVAGLRTLRFGWVDVTKDPCLIAEQVAAVLRSSGWGGQMRPCRRCVESDRGRRLA